MYIPKQGDICYMDFAPTKGHEQTGLRPAIIISRDNYNKYTGLVVLCSITTNTKNFSTHYELVNTKKLRVLFYVNILEVLSLRLKNCHLLKR